MKKWMVYLLALAAIPVLSYGGFGGKDIGKLAPVEAVLLRTEVNNIQLLTDSGQLGEGKTPVTAIEDLSATSSARVILDTAEYLLLEPGTEAFLPQLQKYLRPSCSLCYISGQIDPAAAAKYLQLHQPDLTLAQYEAGERQLPTLIIYEGRMKLVRP